MSLTYLKVIETIALFSKELTGDAALVKCRLLSRNKVCAGYRGGCRCPCRQDSSITRKISKAPTAPNGGSTRARKRKPSRLRKWVKMDSRPMSAVPALFSALMMLPSLCQ